jgi:hypothetical protein
MSCPDDVDSTPVNAPIASRTATLSTDVFSHLERLGLLGDIVHDGFVTMGWEHKVRAFAKANSMSSGPCFSAVRVALVSRSTIV